MLSMSLFPSENDEPIYYSFEKDTFYYTKDEKNLCIPEYDILSICLRIGNWCNYSCPYCLAESNTNGSWINEDNLGSLINFCEKITIPRIVISGGEPTYFWKIKWLLEKLKKRERIIVLATNGSKFIDCSNLVDWIDISLHGFDDKSHKSNTLSKDSMELIEENINKYIDTGINVGCNLLLNNDVEKASTFLQKIVQMGVKKIRLSSITQIGRGRELDNQVLNQIYIRDLAKKLSENGNVTIHIPGQMRNVNLNEYLRGYFRIEPDGFIWAEKKGPKIHDVVQIKRFISQRITEHRKVFIG
ncbi:radical SAM protein [Leptolinea tardivitalis]|uniref:Radical SAM core domain-containing protein n=1 Tax=Leptolinea tardivitalis TaxID=229920 RepID=A0A0P6WXM9_9CHLR|nr:radical SAM protein [Leptolinea tardivitalis]KPL73449.1 hypothetical protein ADM99_04450 [Leptolinea tardivitalis]GAP21610.1 radical SAM superfamily [Leptolinea tardivitalis]